MIPSSREADSPISQQEGSKRDETSCKAPSASSSSPLLRSRDPRIVRVSRALGGKDRHSKVFTVRGLRDRRVRLSVPTAIQLYDLQDRLGLNQPSKVVDWLLNEAKHEIDELPPLPIPPGSFALNHQIALNASQEPIKRAKSKETARESNDEEKGNEADYGVQRSNHHSSMQQSSLNNAVPLPYGSYNYHHVEPSNFGLSHIGSHGFAAPHSTEELHSFNFVPLPSTLSLSSGSQANHFQMLMSPGSQNPSLANPSPYSMSQPFRPFHLSITPRLHPDKEDEFPSK